MKNSNRGVVVALTLVLVFTVGWTTSRVLGRGAEGLANQDDQQSDAAGAGFQMDELEAELADQGRSYLSFLNRSTLRCGVYFLEAGATDNQAPHREDEVYYVRSGKAKLQVEGEDFDASAGAVLFVEANAKHHFHSIEEDLTLLVFFSTADPSEKETSR